MARAKVRTATPKFDSSAAARHAATSVGLVFREVWAAAPGIVVLRWRSAGWWLGWYSKCARRPAHARVRCTGAGGRGPVRGLKFRTAAPRCSIPWWRSGLNYSPPSPVLKHTRTAPQSESESLPISPTSRWGRVTGKSRKYDAACSPACFQSRNSQSVGVKGFGARVVIRPTTRSGRCRWQASVESTTAGRVFVTCAPGNAPTTSPGFNGLPFPSSRIARQPPLLHRLDPGQSMNRTTRSCACLQDRRVAAPNSGPSQPLPAASARTTLMSDSSCALSTMFQFYSQRMTATAESQSRGRIGCGGAM